VWALLGGLEHSKGRTVQQFDVSRLPGIGVPGPEEGSFAGGTETSSMSEPQSISELKAVEDWKIFRKFVQHVQSGSN
jgi:hypothetical protein